jgi:hypothetical protein
LPPRPPRERLFELQQRLLFHEERLFELQLRPLFLKVRHFQQQMPLFK